MNGIFRSRGVRVLSVLLLIFLTLILISSGNEYVSGFISDYVVMPVQQLAAGDGESPFKLSSPPKSRGQLEGEASRLREENRSLRDKLVDYYEVKAENEELRRFYGLKRNDMSLSLLPASVTGRDPNEDFGAFTLNKGSYDGVELNAPVVTENGLVGFVSRVSSRSCRVTTLLSPDAGVGAAVIGSGDSGIISGNASISDDGLTRMINLPALNKIQKDDIVVTSGCGGRFPENLKIGSIISTGTDSYTSMPYAVVRLFEDVHNVSSAAVVLDFSSKGDIDK